MARAENSVVEVPITVNDVPEILPASGNASSDASSSGVSRIFSTSECASTEGNKSDMPTGVCAPGEGNSSDVPELLPTSEHASRESKRSVVFDILPFRLLVTNLPDCDQLALIKELEVVAKERLLDCTFNKNAHSAYVAFNSVEALQRVLLCAPFAIKKSRIKVEIYFPQPNDSECDHYVEISGVNEKLTKESICMYFENAKRSGGGPVDEILVVDYTNRIAHVKFHDKQAAWRVAFKFRHVLNGIVIQVDYPEKQPKPIPPPRRRSKPASENQRVVRCVDRAEYPSISMRLDRATCIAVGSCSLPDAGLLVADRGNSRLTQLNADFSIIAHLQLSGPPFAICYNAFRSEAAVSLHEKCLIQFVRVGGQGLTLSRRIKTDNVCRGVACRQDELWWIEKDSTNTKLIGIYRIKWTHDKVEENIVPRDVANGVEMKDPQHLAVSENGDMLYIACQFDGLLVVGRDGTLIRRARDLIYTSGVCLADKEALFACGTNTVVQYDRDGRHIGQIITREHLRGGSPLAVSYSSSTLIVTLSCRNEIGVFHLK